MPPKTPKGVRLGGRKKGVPNKITHEVRDLCEQLLNNPLYLASFKERLYAGELAPMLEQMVWHYWRGKPKELHEHSGPGGGPIPYTWQQ